MSRPLIVLLAALSLATPAWAQKPPADTPLQAPSAQPAAPIPNARAAADDIIAQGQAGSYFDNVTAERGAPAARHRRSGLLCVFERLDGARITIFPTVGSAAQGDDVGCNLLGSPDLYVVTYYATRYGRGITPEQVFDDAVRVMQQRYGALTPWRGPESAPQLSPDETARLPQFMTRTFVGTERGARIFTRISLCQVGEWTVMLRFTSAESQAAAADQWATDAFARLVLSVVDHAQGERT